MTGLVPGIVRFNTILDEYGEATGAAVYPALPGCPCCNLAEAAKMLPYGQVLVSYAGVDISEASHSGILFLSVDRVHADVETRDAARLARWLRRRGLFVRWSGFASDPVEVAVDTIDCAMQAEQFERAAEATEHGNLGPPIAEA